MARGPFTAETLILDVLVPEDPSAHRILGPMANRRRKVRQDFFLHHRFRDLATWPAGWPKPAVLREDRIPSEKLAYFMWAWLQAGLLSRLEECKLVRQLYSGFGSIEIKVDGEPRTTSHLSRWLALPDEIYRSPGDYDSDDSDDDYVNECANKMLESRLENIRPARKCRAQRGLGQKGAAGTEKGWGDYDADGAVGYLDFLVTHRSDLNNTLEEGGVLNP